MALARKLPLISDRPLAKAGLNSERVLMPNKGPGVFEEEIDGIEDALGITTVEKAVAWAQANSMWPDTFGLACCAIEMMSIVSSRYDISRFGMERFSSSPRQADLLIVSGRVTHKMAGPLRQVYDQMLEPKWVIAMGACASSGGMFNNYTVLQGVDRARRRPRARVPAAPRGVDGGHRPPAREDQGRRASRLPDPRRRAVNEARAMTAVAA
jgi:NADH-quinone oxidoreductase B subunit